METPKQDADPKERPYKLLWRLGLLLLFLNMYLSLVSYTVPVEGDPAGFRYFAAFLNLLANDPGAWTAHLFPALIGFLVVVVALVFPRGRNPRTVSLVFLIAMSCLLVFEISAVVNTGQMRVPGS